MDFVLPMYVFCIFQDNNQYGRFVLRQFEWVYIVILWHFVQGRFFISDYNSYTYKNCIRAWTIDNQIKPKCVLVFILRILAYRKYIMITLHFPIQQLCLSLRLIISYLLFFFCYCIIRSFVYFHKIQDHLCVNQCRRRLLQSYFHVIYPFISFRGLSLQEFIHLVLSSQKDNSRLCRDNIKILWQ